MALVRRLAVWGMSLFIAAIFIDSLRFKFTGHPTPEHIFTTLREWSGIGLFYPAGPWVIGLGELLSASLLVLVPLILTFTGGSPARIGTSRFFGALIAFGIMSGAIGFHLFTPLGIQTPTEWQNGEILAQSPALFIAACITWVFAVILMAVNRPGAAPAD